MRLSIKYRIFDGDNGVSHTGEYITPEREDARDFIEHARKWYGNNIIFEKIKEVE